MPPKFYAFMAFVVDVGADDLPRCYRAFVRPHPEMEQFWVLSRVSDVTSLDASISECSDLPLVVLDRRAKPSVWLNGATAHRRVCIAAESNPGASPISEEVHLLPTPFAITCFANWRALERHATGSDGDEIDLTFVEAPVACGTPYLDIPRLAGGLHKWRIEDAEMGTLPELRTDPRLSLPLTWHLLARWLGASEDRFKLTPDAVYRLVSGYAFCLSGEDEVAIGERWRGADERNRFVPNALCEALDRATFAALLESLLRGVDDLGNFVVNFWFNQAGWWISVYEGGGETVNREMAGEVAPMVWDEMLPVLRTLAERYSFITEDTSSSS